MLHKFLLVTLILVTAAILISCNAVDKINQHKTQLGPETTYADGARRVTIPELEELMKNNEALVLDVRNQAMYDSGHIPGSRLIPSGEILNHVSELPRDRMIVTYCS
jgi:3-mercaptopyruvate sulfurtransferase SseA